MVLCLYYSEHYNKSFGLQTQKHNTTFPNLNEPDRKII